MDVKLRWRLENFTKTTLHKAWVLWYMFKACKTLLKRAVMHDVSKYSNAEAPYFARSIGELRDLKYGSPEYMEGIGRLGPALTHHYENNSHHPEHYGAISIMSPLDRIEMLCDWKAASKRHRTGDMAQSLDVNRKRFKTRSSWVHDGLKSDAEEIGLM